MSHFNIQPSGIMLRPDNARVLIRPFIPGDPVRVSNVIRRALALNEAEMEMHMALVLEEFEPRHGDIRAAWRQNFERVKASISSGEVLSEARQWYIGALFSGEYALESAALFNPSMVLDPDQSGLQDKEVRFVLSLRATGEGHISSIEFRSGVIGADHSIVVQAASRFVSAPAVNPNPTYRKGNFLQKLKEMGFENEWSNEALDSLGELFSLRELETAMENTTNGGRALPSDFQRTMDCVRWLAESNYQVHFAPTLPLAERIIFPISSNESNGMEDARFVRFVEDDGSVLYYATYTAYNGRAILPQLLETTDFLNFRALTLNGGAVQNKGMAFFPRRIRGKYAMISRQDDENLFLMLSDNPHFWSETKMLRQPEQHWEMVKIGNCGSPIETDAGWLLITHGVGPMRKYCIGAILLDLEDPSKVIGFLREPLLSAVGSEREGYVPNVVYTCGAMLHNGRLILPYALSDTASTIVSMDIKELLSELTRSTDISL